MNVNKILNQTDNSDEAARWISICGEQGRYTLIDDEDGETVSFLCTDGYETITVSEMNAIDPITEPDSEETMGYKYQLRDGGKWGFISKGFLQFVYPIFEDIVAINSNEGFCLAAYADAGSEKIDISFSKDFQFANMHREHRLLDIEYMYSEEQNINCFRNVNKEDFLPTEEAIVERDTVDCGRVTFYKPLVDAKKALVNNANGEGFKQILFKLEGKILCNTYSHLRIPATGLNFQSCCRAL